MLFNLLLKPTSEKFRFKHAICDYKVEPPTENQEKNPNQRLFTCQVPDSLQRSCHRCSKIDVKGIHVFSKHVVPEAQVTTVVRPRGPEHHTA